MPNARRSGCIQKVIVSDTDALHDDVHRIESMVPAHLSKVDGLLMTRPWQGHQARMMLRWYVDPKKAEPKKRPC
jgi:hypothetical protein